MLLSAHAERVSVSRMRDITSTICPGVDGGRVTSLRVCVCASPPCSCCCSCPPSWSPCAGLCLPPRQVPVRVRVQVRGQGATEQGQWNFVTWPPLKMVWLGTISISGTCCPKLVSPVFEWPLPWPEPMSLQGDGDEGGDRSEGGEEATWFPGVTSPSKPKTGRGLSHPPR